jgi:hypothetical protein
MPEKLSVAHVTQFQKALADQATAFQKALNDVKARADQAIVKADKALLQSRASSEDARLHASRVSKSLIVRITYDKPGFLTKHASSAETFTLSLDGEKS